METTNTNNNEIIVENETNHFEPKLKRGVKPGTKRAPYKRKKSTGEIKKIRVMLKSIFHLLYY